MTAWVLLSAVRTPGDLAQVFGASAVLFGSVAAVLWGAEWALNRTVFVPRDGHVPFPGHPATGRGAAALYALRHAPWIVAVTLGISWATTSAARALGWDLPHQELLDWLRGDAFTPAMKALVIGYVLVMAPVLEELIFRRFLFRAGLRLLPAGAAIALSAAAFSAVHLYLAVFLPIFFFGAMLAIAYRRTGRLLAPILLHAVFNLTNVVLVFTFPELA